MSVVALLPAAAAAATVRVSGPALAPLPASPAGLSVETDLLPAWWGPRSCRSPVRETLRMAGRPELRIGGDSQDRLWPNSALPPGQRQIASGPLFHAVRCAGATGSPILLGLNLLGRDPQATGDLLAAVRGLVPEGRLAIAIGNEPNLYGARLPDYSAYLGLYESTLAALKARFGPALPPVAGPDPATWRWAPETARFISDVHPAQATVHYYGLSGCGGHPATVAQLLDPLASVGGVLGMSTVARAARQAHIRAQIDEANSVACRGRSGVSDTPASALWALSVLGAATTTGFDRVQFHSSRSAYDPFVLQPGGTVAFRPLWTAILLVDALWPQGTRPLRVQGALPPSVGMWAARRPDGGLALLAVNRDPSASRHVTVRTSARTALLGRLEPRGAFSVTLDGRQLGWSHGAPAWAGRRRLRGLAPGHGRLDVALPPGTAAWLVLGGRPAARTPATLTG